MVIYCNKKWLEITNSRRITTGKFPKVLRKKKHLRQIFDKSWQELIAKIKVAIASCNTISKHITCTIFLYLSVYKLYWDLDILLVATS